jgi:hemerythrin
MSNSDDNEQRCIDTGVISHSNFSTAGPEDVFVVWMAAYEVGHTGLDVEHRRLVDSINRIHSAETNGRAPSQIAILLTEFESVAVEHLRHENSVMREMGDFVAHSQENRLQYLKAMSDAVIEEHIVEHAVALLGLRKIIREYQSEHCTDDHLVSNSLRNWFVEHAVKYDAHLKAVFQAQ